MANRERLQDDKHQRCAYIRQLQWTNCRPHSNAEIVLEGKGKESTVSVKLLWRDINVRLVVLMAVSTRQTRQVIWIRSNTTMNTIIVKSLESNSSTSTSCVLPRIYRRPTFSTSSANEVDIRESTSLRGKNNYFLFCTRRSECAQFMWDSLEPTSVGTLLQFR